MARSFAAAATTESTGSTPSPSGPGADRDRPVSRPVDRAVNRPVARPVDGRRDATRTGKVIPLRPLVPPPAETASDADLLARCRERDAEAWNLLVGRYERLVYSVARRNGLSAEDAADVTQGTFLSLIDSLDKLRDEDRLASWLMTVARRQAWRMRNASRRDAPLECAPEEVDDPLADWDTVVTLHTALAQLGGTCKQLLEALYFEPEAPSYAEIADRLGRSIGGIGPLRGRCLEKLRAILAEEESA